ncbi:RDD family protein [Nocardia salmonicida]|uniref:RDD family protein n=1 Tax=Nocardia salmonicida TaxID=53431 RepID=UPI00366F6AAF
MTEVPAPFFRRLAARVLDLVFCLVLTFVIAVPVGIIYAIVYLTAGDGWVEEWSGGVLVCFCYFSAYVALEVFLLTRRQGQTLGKGLLSLRVIPSDPWARPKLEFGQALTRMSMIFAPFVFMSLSGGNAKIVVLNVLAQIGMASLVIDLLLTALRVSGRRALHDYAAGTRVVRSERRKLDLKKDLPMLLPNKASFVKN